MREIKWRVRNAFTGQWLFYTVCGVEGSDYSGGLGWDINSIGEYTGLKDKNGVEIFEGDVVRHPIFYKPMEVVHYCRFISKFTAIDEHGIPMINIALTVCEVIGNIYENPELLET